MILSTSSPIQKMASATLEEKINKIRQQNEEIRRRHEEVEADKQNAAKLNALVKMVPPTDWPERKEPPEFSNPPPQRNNGNFKPKNSSREYRGQQQQQYHPGGGEGKKTHVFADGDGPPPDPSYNFLADSEREERNREESRDERFRGRGGPQRGGSRRRGGGREGHSKEYRGAGPAPKDATKPEYEAWRAERNRIDEARISRQRTAEGNWRREWDNNKMNVEEDEAGTPKVTRLDLADIPRKEHKDFDKWQSDGNDYDSPRGRGGKQYIGRGAPRGSHNNRVYSFDQFHGPVSPPATKTPLSPNGIDDRMVLATDKSLKVIVNHGTTGSKGPVMSVKVSPASIAGTGRVGPRQKPRIIYSSQSETEQIGHELDTSYSRHKSPEDKTNRVSFNRDVGEQQRYAPKSPHPQRKGDGNLKSPYLGRKEYKHGENEPKSPYLQRREFKDPPKSPHFQKKFDFTNRESTQKLKNNVDSFKPNNPQRRNAEKTKTDSPKFPVPRKPDDSSAPKPQRINKRIDKSKGFNSNPKETREFSRNENNDLENNLSAEESAKNVLNGDQSHLNVEKDILGDSVSNTDLETESESTSDALKLIDDSEAAILISSEVPESENEAKLNPGDTETITVVKCDEKMQEVANPVKDELIIENEKDTDDRKDTQVPSENELKYEENPIEAESIDNVEKIEEKIAAVENELKIDQISLQTEESVEQVPQIQNNSEESQEKKVDESKDEAPLEPEEIPNDIPATTEEMIVSLKKSEEKMVETLGIELEIKETKDESSSKSEETGIEVSKPEDSSHSEELKENITTAENEMKIDETKDAIIPLPKAEDFALHGKETPLVSEEPVAPLNNDVNEIVKDSLVV